MPIHGLGSALVNRRDVTEQREQETTVGLFGPTSDGLMVTELLAVLHTLQHTLNQDRSQLTQLCVTDREPAQLLMDNFPVPGARRLIVRRAGSGGSYTLAANEPTLLVPANENRLGLTIVNAGAHAVTLYGSVDLLQPGSSSPLAGGAPQAVLAAGASWDGRLGSLLWCGNVLAVDTTGGAVISVWEV